ncbi:MAG: hypothetical protein QME66_11785 [Candidatus Eisenbacteria bacterium]|nr:hypothetical protein [Candidatus Eisenbacteria bacterium]
MKKILVIVSVLISISWLCGVSLARPVSQIPQERIVSDDTPFITVEKGSSHYTGPDFFASGAAETIWYGGTQIVGGRPFAAIGGKWTWNASGWGGIPHSGLYLDGWVSRDMLYKTDVYHRGTTYGDEYFRRHDLSDTPCFLTKPPQWGTYVFWAGLTTTEANALCWAAGSGYGDSWDQILQNTIALSGDAVTTLEFDYAFDSELGYDSSSVEISVGTAWMKLSQVNGGRGGYSGEGSGHESVNIGPYLTGAGSYGIRFRFHSDGGWSDEDGLNWTNCGALIVDNIKIAEPTNGVIHSCDAETGNCGWEWQPWWVGPGDWVHLEYNPVIEDPCIASDPSWCQMGDSIVTMYDIAAPPTAPHRRLQENWIISPTIPIKGTPAEGLPTHIIQFERYGDLPQYNRVYYLWYVRYYPWDCGFGPRWSPWRSNNTYYYSATKSCGLFTSDFSGIVPSCVDSVEMVIATICLCSGWDTYCTYLNNKTPYFDNARFGVVGSALASTITDVELEKYQDVFPADGTLNCTSAANIGIPLGHGASYLGLGDTLV